MKKNIVLILLFLSFIGIAHATITPGYVPVATSGGTAPNIQNSNITNISGNVGIGTSVAQSLLSIGTSSNGGSITKNAFNIDSNGNITNLGGVAANINAGGWNQLGAGTDVQFGNAANSTNDGVKLYNLSSTGHIDFAPSNTIVDKITSSGNLGIGTLTPQGSLDVGNGTICLGGVCNSAWPGGGGSFTGTQPNIIGSNGIKLNPSGGQDLMILTGGDSFGIGSYLPQGGNVGIGTFNPGVLLDVASSIRAGIGSQTNASFIAGSDNTTGIFNPVDILHGWAVTTNGQERLRVNGNGNVGVGSTTPGQSLDVTGTVRATNFIGNGSGLTGISVISGLTTNNIPKATSSTNIGPGTMTDVGGNVGVGSTTPRQKLDVSGSIQATSFVTNGGTSSQFTKGDGSLDSNIYCQQGGTNCPTGGVNPWLVGSGAGNFGISTTGTGGNVGIGTTFGNAGLSVMSGNVGIGTNNPGQALDVQGTLRVLNGGVSIGTSLTTNYLQVGTSSQFNVTSAGAVTAASINSTGNIIGGTNVFITGGTGSIGNTNVGAGSAVTFVGGNSSTSFNKIESTSAIGTTDSIRLVVGTTGATEAMRVQDNSGVANIGIGTINPLGQLDVEGTAKVTSFYGNSSGNVGIGTINPSQTLSINGVIGFKQNAPTITSCGTTPSGSVIGNDAQGTITVGGTATACTLAFTGTYAKSSHCNVTNQSMSITNAMTYTESNSGFVVSQAVGLSGDLLDYHCTFDN